MRLRHLVAILAVIAVTLLVNANISHGAVPLPRHTPHVSATADCPTGDSWRVIPHVTVDNGGTYTVIYAPARDGDGTWHVSKGSMTFGATVTITYADGHPTDVRNLLVDRPMDCTSPTAPTTSTTTVSWTPPPTQVPTTPAPPPIQPTTVVPTTPAPAPPSTVTPETSSPPVTSRVGGATPTPARPHLPATCFRSPCEQHVVTNDGEGVHRLGAGEALAFFVIVVLGFGWLLFATRRRSPR